MLLGVASRDSREARELTRICGVDGADVRGCPSTTLFETGVTGFVSRFLLLDGLENAMSGTGEGVDVEATPASGGASAGSGAVPSTRTGEGEGEGGPTIGYGEWVVGGGSSWAGDADIETSGCCGCGEDERNNDASVECRDWALRSLLLPGDSRFDKDRGIVGDMVMFDSMCGKGAKPAT